MGTIVAESAKAEALIYKVVPDRLWAEARSAGRLDGAPVDLADGYIHFSTSTQLRETLAKHFAGKDNLVLLAVDPVRLGEDLKWEPSRGGALFPHLYAPLAVADVAHARPLPLGPDGVHLVKEALA